MKRKFVLLAALFVLPMGSAFAGAWLIPTPCTCAVGTPIPDQDTQRLLDNFGNSRSPIYVGPAVFVPGDTITICNVYGCTTYTYTQNYLYSGGQYQPSAGHPSGGSSSGGNGGGGASLGGGTGGSGSDDDCHCNPTVTVGTA